MNTEICSTEKNLLREFEAFFKVLAGMTPLKHGVSLGDIFQGFGIL